MGARYVNAKNHVSHTNSQIISYSIEVFVFFKTVTEFELQLTNLNEMFSNFQMKKLYQ